MDLLTGTTDAFGNAIAPLPCNRTSIKPAYAQNGPTMSHDTAVPLRPTDFSTYIKQVGTYISNCQMGFTLKETVEVPKLALKAMRYQHSETGLNHIHVRRPDSNRVFSLAFKTEAPDKTGVPHILEHTTLCGSNKYPVRDPFFKMQTRSLANYMNALTGTDYTYYPFATTNKQDFSNLQNVYMDSVFDPLLREQDFNQEGWRLENADVNDISSPLEFKGVVFNEMKGQMSMPAYYFWTSFFQSIYPSLEYSAGDPEFIPNLTYDQLVNYHHSKYHPDNCVTFSYGDFDASESMGPLDAYLSTVKPGQGTKAAINKQLPEPVSLKENVKVVKKGPIDPMYDESKQYKISLTWFVGSPADVTHTLAWRVLGLLLTDGHASPFYKSIIDSGLAPEFTVNTGLEDTPAKLMFTIGAQGIEADKLEEFKGLVKKTLEKTCEDGFEQSRVDAIVHQAELSDREMDANFGMNLLGRVVGRAFHPNDDVMDTFDNEALLGKFKKLLADDPQWFQTQIKNMLDSNYFEFVMEPSKQFESDLAQKEAGLLESRVRGLSDSEKRAIHERGLSLAESQNSVQDVDVLPKVTPADISKTTMDYPVEQSKIHGSKVTVRETPTQGVSYMNIMRNVTHIKPELMPYLQLYTESLTNVGTTAHSMGQLEDLIKLNSGGLSVGAASRRLYGKPLGLEIGYGIYGLDSKVPKMYELLQEVATRPQFSNLSKIKSLVDGNAGNIMNALSQSGHSYAVGMAGSAVNERKALDARLGGFSYVKQLKRLSQLDESALGAELVPKLEAIHAQEWKVRSAVTCSPGSFDLHVKPLGDLLSNVGAAASQHVPIEDVQLGSKRTFVNLPFQVSYVGASVSANVDYEHPDSAALAILANILTNRHLHTEIREKGGAYGGGSSYNALEGLFNFYSYRDPNPQNSLQVIQNAGEWSAEHKWTAEDVAEGQVGVFQGIDAPISPRSEITYAVRTGLSAETRQRRRENLLAVTPEDLNRVAHTYLVNSLDNFESAGVCVLGPSDAGIESWCKLEI